MAEKTTNYQCPACTGPLHYDGASGKLVCDYCGSAYDVKDIEARYAKKQAAADTAAESDAKKAARLPRQDSPVWSEAEAEGLNSYSCPPSIGSGKIPGALIHIYRQNLWGRAGL